MTGLGFRIYIYIFIRFNFCLYHIYWCFEELTVVTLCEFVSTHDIGSKPLYTSYAIVYRKLKSSDNK